MPMTNKFSAFCVDSSAELGPYERAKLDALLDHIQEYGTTSEGVLRLASQLCQSVRAAQRERCAKLCEQQVEGYTAHEMLDRDVPWEARTLGEIEMARQCAAAIREPNGVVIDLPVPTN